MKNRVITSAAILIAMLLLVIFSEFIFYSVAIAILGIIAVMEILRVMGAHKEWLLSVPAYIFVPVFPVLAYFIKSSDVLNYLLALAACIFVYLFWLMGVGVFSKGRIPFSRIGEVFAGVSYIAVAFASLSLIRYIDREIGIFTVVLVFLISWTCDVFAFATGVLIGKHKLIPEVSPKKTVEGAIGGIVFSLLFCLLYGLGLDLLIENMSVSYLTLALFGLILPVVSQLGDLVASLIKREYGIKDYGKIFPGHGGVMDRFDSVLAVSTILMILCIIFPPFKLV